MIVDPERPNSENRKFRYNPNTFLDSRIKTKLIDIKKSKTDKQNKPFINYLKLKNSKTRITVSEIKFIISKHKNNNIIIKIQYHNPNFKKMEPQQNDNNHKPPAVEVVDKNDKEYAIIIDQIKDEKLIESQQYLFEALKRAKLNEKKAFQLTSTKCKIIFRNEEDRNNAIKNEDTIKTTFGYTIKIYACDSDYILILYNVSQDFTKDFILEDLREKIEGITKINPFGKNKHYKIYFDSVKNQVEAFMINKVKIGYYDYKLNLPNPQSMQCLKCGKLGHRAKRCKTKMSVCMNCQEEHETKNCKGNNRKCINCEGNHSTLSRRCPVTRYEKIKRKKANEREFINKYMPNNPSMTLEQSFDRLIDREVNREVKKAAILIKKKVSDVAKRSMSKRTDLLSSMFNIYNKDVILVSKPKKATYSKVALLVLCEFKLELDNND